MRAVLVFDADNTLWDTNAVFHGAQLALLKTLARAKLITKPNLQLGTLRTIDQELVRKLGRAEYDFKLLSVALAYYFSQRSTVTEAVQVATEHVDLMTRSKLARIIDESYQVFEEWLKHIPSLYPNTIPILSAIHGSASQSNPLITIILSEGNHTRLEQILEAHAIRSKRLFDEIIIAPKSKDALEQTKRIGLQLLSDEREDEATVFVLIGDSLQRDIKFGNQAGYITIYKPSAFKGIEIPNMLDEQPSFIIKGLEELPAILRENLGLSIQAMALNRL